MVIHSDLNAKQMKKKFPLCFSSKLLANLCTHFTLKSYALFITKRQLRESSETEVLVYYLFIKSGDLKCSSRHPPPAVLTAQCSIMRTCPVTSFFIVNGRSNPLKTPQYNASQHAPSFSCWLYAVSFLLTVSKAVKATQMSTFTYCFPPHSWTSCSN